MKINIQILLAFILVLNVCEGFSQSNVKKSQSSTNSVKYLKSESQNDNDFEHKCIDTIRNHENEVINYDSIIKPVYNGSAIELYNMLSKAFKDPSIDYSKSEERVGIGYTVTKIGKIEKIGISIINGQVTNYNKYLNAAQEIMNKTENRWQPAIYKGNPINFKTTLIIYLSENL